MPRASNSERLERLMEGEVSDDEAFSNWIPGHTPLDIEEEPLEECTISRADATKCLDDALEAEWLLPREAMRLRAYFQQSITEIVQAQKGEAKLRKLGRKAAKHGFA